MYIILDPIDTSGDRDFKKLTYTCMQKKPYHKECIRTHCPLAR